MSKVLPLQKSTLANVVRYIGGINTHQFRPLKALWTSIVSRTQWWHPETSNHWIISSLTKHKQTGVRKFEVRWSQLLGAPLKSCEFSSKVWAAIPPWSNRSTLKHGVMWLVRLLLYLYWFVNPCVGTWIYSQVYCFCMLLFQEDIKKCFGGSVNSALRRFEKSRPTPHRCNIRIVRVIPCKMLPQAVSPHVYIWCKFGIPKQEKLRVRWVKKRRKVWRYWKTDWYEHHERKMRGRSCGASLWAKSTQSCEGVIRRTVVGLENAAHTVARFNPFPRPLTWWISLEVDLTGPFSRCPVQIWSCLGLFKLSILKPDHGTTVQVNLSGVAAMRKRCLLLRILTCSFDVAMLTTHFHAFKEYEGIWIHGKRCQAWSPSFSNVELKVHHMALSGSQSGSRTLQSSKWDIWLCMNIWFFDSCKNLIFKCGLRYFKARKTCSLTSGWESVSLYRSYLKHAVLGSYQGIVAPSIWPTESSSCLLWRK